MAWHRREAQKAASVIYKSHQTVRIGYLITCCTMGHVCVRRRYGKSSKASRQGLKGKQAGHAEALLMANGEVLVAA